MQIVNRIGRDIETEEYISYFFQKLEILILIIVISFVCVSRINTETKNRHKFDEYSY